jgi:LuxR family maltose regulon positive regulatory protein
VHRQRLLDALAQSAAPLVLISAPAGMGKTALAADWARSHTADHHVVWVDCQDEDVDPLDVVYAAIRPGSHAGGVGLPALPHPRRARLLIDAIDSSPVPVLAILDGYELASLAAAPELDSLLRYANGGLRVGLTTRVDPVLPLHRYRLNESILEIRAADLAFTDDEAALLLRDSEVSLDGPSVSALNARLAGWAAGLRFAARALSACDEPDDLVSTAVTYNGDINAFLVGEVLDVQPPRIRDLMLTASVPDVIRRDLLEDLTGLPAGPSLLDLERANVFLEALPGDPSLIRYVPFFRSLLRAQLAYEDPERTVDLHRRAAEWYTRHRMWDEAMAHRVRAGDGAGVTDLLIGHLLIGRLLCEAPSAELRAATDAAQASASGGDTQVLAAALAYAEGDPARCADRLHEARSSMDLTPSALVVAAVVDALRAEACEDATEAAALASTAQAVLASHALALGTALPAGDLAALTHRASATAAMRLGAVNQAAALLREALDSATASWSPSFRAQCLATLAVLDAHAGRVTRALAGATEALRAAQAGDAADAPGHTPRRWDGMDGLALSIRSAAHVARAYAALEAHDLAAARQHLAWTAPHPRPMWRALREIVAAGLERSEGQLRSAADRIDGVVVDLVAGDPWVADWLRVEGSLIKLALREPREALAGLAGVTHESHCAAAAEAVAHHAAGERGAAAHCLAGPRTAEAPTVRAQVAHELAVATTSAQVAPQRARAAVREALRLARPEGLRRPFFEAGPSVLAILHGTGAVPGSDWLSPDPCPVDEKGARPVASVVGPENHLIEQLTARELEILLCLNELLTTEEIAQRLFVSVNTVRTHVRNILAKLGVTRRSAAVREARRIGLLPGP